jgi:hypothetical protein
MNYNGNNNNNKLVDTHSRHRRLVLMHTFNVVGLTPHYPNKEWGRYPPTRFRSERKRQVSLLRAHMAPVLVRKGTVSSSA